MKNLYTAEILKNAIITRKHLVPCESESVAAAKRTATRRQQFWGTELIVVRVWDNDGGFDVVASKVGGKWSDAI